MKIFLPPRPHARREISLLANLGTSRTIVEGLSQSLALIMIAGYAAFVPGLAIVYFHNILAACCREERHRGRRHQEG